MSNPAKKQPTPAAAAAAAAAATPIKHDLTVLWHALEHWQRDNAYIRTSYRPASSSYTSSLRSLLHLHNETVNIHTHLLGSLAFCISARPFLAALRARGADALELRVFAVFFAGAAACLAASAAFHAFSNHSGAVARWGNKLDYLGIVALIWASFVPSVYYAFGCRDPELVGRYWAMITTLGVGCAAAATLERFRTPEWRAVRAGMFAALGLSAVVPVLHGLKLYGWAGMEDLMGLRWVVAHGLMYLVGAGLYAARIPERYAPGRFDVFGSSHQIFHVLVLAAAVTHLVGLTKAFGFRHSSGVLATCVG